jgi:hypothetical protein
VREGCMGARRSIVSGLGEVAHALDVRILISCPHVALELLRQKRTFKVSSQPRTLKWGPLSAL